MAVTAGAHEHHYRIFSSSEYALFKDHRLRNVKRDFPGEFSVKRAAKMFSKPIPKPPEPTLPRSSSTAAQRESLDTGRVNFKRESAEYRAFQKCFADFAGASGILTPAWLADQLFSKGLIGPELRREAQKQAIEERSKIERLLSAVEDQIVASPTTKFREFLGILQSEPSLQNLATRLGNAYHELCTPSASPSTPIPLSQHLTTCIQPNYSLPTSSPQHLPSNSCLPLPPAKRPKIDAGVQCQYPLEHTMQPPDIRQDHHTCSQERTVQSTTLYDSGGQSSAVDTYASYLKSVYTREKLLIYDKWPLVKSKKYINLALITREDITKHEADQFTKATIHGNVDDIKKSKRAMDIGEIAQLPGGTEPKCILIEGAPGVGKSTLAWKLCRKWGKGMLLKQYGLVVLLRLRDTHVRGAMNISDLFRYHDHQIQQAAVDEIQRTGGKGVLLLFEGYDELPDDLRTKNSVFLDVITGRELPEATVLITSRPWASKFLHWQCKRHISQYIEILGFTKEDIQSYLESATADDPSLLTGLKKYISCYPHINNLMYIPLNCAIVVEVYENSRKDETLVPKTMTELYSSLVRSLLLRHLFDHPEHSQKRWRVRSFKDLPQDVYKQLCELGRIAYEGILHDQQVIFSDLPDDFETLGLMHCSQELFVDEGVPVSYNFLHLTIQEYLAAFHLSQQPVEDQIRKYQESKDTLYYKQWGNHFHMVLQFLSGIRKFQGYPSEVMDTLGVVIKDDSEDIVVVNFTTLHWMFEAQDSDVIGKLLKLSYVQVDTKLVSNVTPFDSFVLGYCVAHSNCKWIIYLWDSHFGDEGVEMLVQGVVEKKTHCTGRIYWIDLTCENDITSEGVKYLLTFPLQFIRGLEGLGLNNNSLDSRSCAILAHFIPHVPHLKKLGLAINPNIGEGGAVPLITSLIDHNSLKFLDLHKTGIGVEDCQALSELISSSTSLKELDISVNNLSPNAVELIFSGFHHNTILMKLKMSKSRFSLQNTILLASVLRTNHTLVSLDLCHCNIDSDGACQLASALCTNHTLQELNLQDNPVGMKGAVGFADMLHKNRSLKVLDIRDQSVGVEGTRKVLDSLAHNATMEALYVASTFTSFSTVCIDSRVSTSRQSVD